MFPSSTTHRLYSNSFKWGIIKCVWTIAFFQPAYLYSVEISAKKKILFFFSSTYKSENVWPSWHSHVNSLIILSYDPAHRYPSRAPWFSGACFQWEEPGQSFSLSFISVIPMTFILFFSIDHSPKISTLFGHFLSTKSLIFNCSPSYEL